jgi:hypothetical protein
MRTLPWLTIIIIALVNGCGSSETARESVDSGTSSCQTPSSAYPAGPYGYDVGSVIEPSSFTGRKSGVPAANAPYDKIALADYYAMRNSGKRYLVLNVAAFWCTNCADEAKDIQKNYLPKYGAKGVEFLSIVLEKANGAPAAPPDVDIWIKSNQGLTFAVADDPDYCATQYFNPKSMPLNMIIDLSNMTILTKTIGANLPAVAAKLDTLLGGS